MSSMRMLSYDIFEVINEMNLNKIFYFNNCAILDSYTFFWKSKSYRYFKTDT